MPLHKDISTTPSEAIHQALDDLEIVRRTPGYKVDMDVWYRISEGTCSVCLGGAMMAAVLDYHPDIRRRLTNNMDPSGLLNDTSGLITDDQHTMICAMDDIRATDSEEVQTGLDSMDMPQEIIESVVDECYTDYDDDPDLFIFERRQLADALKARGY